jgi:hypothetical protein
MGTRHPGKQRFSGEKETEWKGDLEPKSTSTFCKVLPNKLSERGRKTMCSPREEGVLKGEILPQDRNEFEF